MLPDTGEARRSATIARAPGTIYVAKYLQLGWNYDIYRYLIFKRVAVTWFNSLGPSDAYMRQ